jgi:hypothetical protein
MGLVHRPMTTCGNSNQQDFVFVVIPMSLTLRTKEQRSRIKQADGGKYMVLDLKISTPQPCQAFRHRLKHDPPITPTKQDEIQK